MPLVSVARFPALPQAQLAVTVLEQRGVEAFAIDGNATSADPFAPLAARGAILQVEDEDAARARTLLEENGFGADVRRASTPAAPTAPTWPRPFRLAGGLTLLAAVLLWLTHADPVAYWLGGIGAAMLLAGVVRGRQRGGPAGG
jgi:hypothetical protein